MIINDKVIKNELNTLYRIIIATTDRNRVFYIVDNNEIFAGLERDKFLHIPAGAMHIAIVIVPEGKKMTRNIYAKELKGFKLIPVEVIREVEEAVKGSEEFEEIQNYLSSAASAQSGIVTPEPSKIIL